MKVLSKSEAPRILLTHTENIGLGGVCCIIKQEVKLFTDVELEVDLLDDGDHVKTIGKIVWVVRRKATETFKPMFYDVGVEFSKISEKDKLHLNQVIDRLIQNGNVILKESD